MGTVGPGSRGDSIGRSGSKGHQLCDRSVQGKRQLIDQIQLFEAGEDFVGKDGADFDAGRYLRSEPEQLFDFVTVSNLADVFLDYEDGHVNSAVLLAGGGGVEDTEVCQVTFPDGDMKLFLKFPDQGLAGSLARIGLPPGGDKKLFVEVFTI